MVAQRAVLIVVAWVALPSAAHASSEYSLTVEILDPSAGPRFGHHIQLWRTTIKDAVWTDDAGQGWARSFHTLRTPATRETTGTHRQTDWATVFTAVEPGQWRVTVTRHGLKENRDPTPLLISRVVCITDRRPHAKAGFLVPIHRICGLAHRGTLVPPALAVQFVDDAQQDIADIPTVLFTASGIPIAPGNNVPFGWVFSGSDGRLEYRSLKPGRYRLEVNHRPQRFGQPRYALPDPGHIDVTITDAPLRINVTLKAESLSHDDVVQQWPFVVEGQVTDGQGRPVAETTVLAHSGIGTLFETGRTATDIRGRYTLRFGAGMRMSDADEFGLGVQYAIIRAERAGYAVAPEPDGTHVTITGFETIPPSYNVPPDETLLHVDRVATLNFTMKKTAPQFP
jgi:hypothetical protein